MATVTSPILNVPPHNPHDHERAVSRVNAVALAGELHRVVKGEVRFDSTTRGAYARAGANYRQVPIGVVTPRDADDVIAAVAVCRKFGAPVLGRGGGTSLAGQCVNVAIVFDFSKFMHRVLEVNADERYARVEPGVILDTLRHEAEKHHLTFGPDPSTHSHCTLGGMIGNNSCGVHSIMAGRTAENVEELTILTYDGEIMTVGATSDDELERIIEAGGRKGEIYRHLREIRDEYGDRVRERYPDIPRRVSGYNLDELLPEKGFHVARALVGTESTCVLVLEAKVRLVHSPPARSVVVLGFPDIYQAGDVAHEIRQNFGPIGLEGMDDRLVQLMRERHMHPADLKLLPDGHGWLLVEFGGDTKEESDAKALKLTAAAKTLAGSPSAKLYDDRVEERRLWEVREAGLGATAYEPGRPPTHEGWEDSAVPPERVGAYLRDLRALFDRYGYGCALYGHFGDGCIHVRIDFDLRSAHGLQKYRAFVDDAADLVISYGGSLSGEHGDGQSRGPLLSKMFGEDLIEAFRQFKATWDPQWKMNPGKVIDAYAITENLALGTDYDPPILKTHFSFGQEGGSFADAADRCVGVGNCRRIEPHDDEVMCPSYMVTREEIHSTRGRSRLLFEMMRGEEVGGPWDSKEVHEALDLCLSCKGCLSDCPVNVDMASYKAEFYSHYFKHHMRPRSAFSMGLIYWWSRLAAYVPNLANLISQTPALAAIAKTVGGITQHRAMPPFATETFKTWFRRRAPRNVGSPQMLLWPDTFTNHLHPEIAKAAVEVIEHMGWQVTIPGRSLCCGRPLYDYGFLDQAEKLWRDVIDTLRPQIRAGVPLVGLEPSCLAAFRDELVNLFPHDEDAKRLSKQSLTLAEFLLGHCDEDRLPRLERKALVHPHCHHHAVMKFHKDQQLFKKIGLDAELSNAGCCGLAGSFGFEEDHYDVSMAVGEKKLLPMVRELDRDTLVLADGFSCETQIQHGSGREAMHLAQALQMAIHKGARGTQGSLPERAHPKVRLAFRPTKTEIGLTTMAGVAVGGLLAWGAARLARR